jgi:predicted TIM-barrel fold metal-dependent hydrolase
MPAEAGVKSIVDTHVYLSRWPCRRIVGDQPEEMVTALRSQGVVQAWAGSFDALLHKDISAVNERLAEECSKFGPGLLVPFGAVNPMLPDWEDDLRRCHEDFRMPGIRLHPNYHRYTLEDPVVIRLLRLASDRGLLVQIAAWMEDERTQTPAMQAQIVDLQSLPGLLQQAPKTRIMVLNGFISLRSVQLPWDQLKKVKHLAFDAAMMEQLAGVRLLVDQVGVERVVFGSYSPMFYFESALLKLREGALTEGETEAVLHANARRLIEKL